MEARMSWRLAGALKQLLAEVNAEFPGRPKQSDGTIGDLAHSSRTSDHNPNSSGVVTALDVTEAWVGGHRVADNILYLLLERRDPRVKYIIHEGSMWSSYPKGGYPAWAKRPYTGSNKHFQHIHVSVHGHPDLADDRAGWGLAEFMSKQLTAHEVAAGKTQPTDDGGFLMALTDQEQKDLLVNVRWAHHYAKLARIYSDQNRRVLKAVAEEVGIVPERVVELIEQAEAETEEEGNK
jgi:hypothetical protein